MSPEKVRARWTSEGRTAAFVTASMSAYGDTGAAGTATVPAEAAEAARAMRMVEYAERGMGGIIADEGRGGSCAQEAMFVHLGRNLGGKRLDSRAERRDAYVVPRIGRIGVHVAIGLESLEMSPDVSRRRSIGYQWKTIGLHVFHCLRIQSSSTSHPPKRRNE